MNSPDYRNVLRFVNDIIKPWDELNDLLVQRYAYQPNLSDATRMTSSLAVSIKHYPELLGLSREVVDAESFDNRLMSDVADAAKHGKLRNATRDNTLYVAALFECSEDKFRFIRNAVYVDHAGAGEHDFMRVALRAIRYWLRRASMVVAWTGEIKEAPEEYYPTAHLYYNPKYGIQMSSTRARFFARTESGGLEPYDPPKCSIELRMLPGSPA